MLRRSFLGRAAVGVLGLLSLRALDPDTPSLWTRLIDYLTYRPWTDEEIADRVAWMMAHGSYRPWHAYEVYAKIPLLIARPGGHTWSTPAATVKPVPLAVDTEGLRNGS